MRARIVDKHKKEDINMEFQKTITLADGRKCILRNARLEDAEALIEYLKVTAKETPFLVKEPEEITLTIEQEKEFIQARIDDEKELLLIGEIDGEHVGNCSVMAVSSMSRYRHRCSLGIALYQKYCGLGVGKQMFQTILEVAKECGYEVAELEVVTTNTQAVHLYESFGFEIYGTQKHNMKYKDGSYADVYMMMKEL